MTDDPWRHRIRALLSHGLATARTATRAAGAIAAVAAGLMLAKPAQAQDDFYAVRPSDLAGKPGSIIRSEKMFFGPVGAEAYRVLYRSKGLSGENVPVSGVVIVPKSVSGRRDRPIVAWAHPTTGVVPRCAPSLASFQFQQISGLRQFINSGYIVAATDYPGLGTAGPHPFLVGESEGRAVLDMVRATKQLLGPGSGRQVALWGHSQGGQAVLFAARLAHGYAPDLDIAAVAAAAPATDLGRLMKDDLGTGGGDNLLAMTLWSWSRVFGIPLGGVVKPEALPVMDKLAGLCLESPIDILPRRRLGRALTKDFLTDPGFADRDPWRRLLAGNTARPLPPAYPVFLAQGTADTTVRPDVTRAYARRLCRNGSRLTYLPVAGVGHGLVAHDAAPALAGWLADRFARKAAPSDCAGLKG